jgi:crossover junction endodeoxyribonuclease RuvC
VIKRRVVGIDPGSILCGYGIVEQDSRRNLLHVSSGTITLARNKPLETRLKVLYGELRSILLNYSPDEAVIEKVFFAKGIKAALNLGHARGVVLLAIAEEDINLFEYNPNEVKKAVVGYGKAEKSQVQQMVKTILSLNDDPLPDSADALALAICHLNTIRNFQHFRS